LRHLCGVELAHAGATDTRGELGARSDNLQLVDGMPLVLRARRGAAALSPKAAPHSLSCVSAKENLKVQP